MNVLVLHGPNLNLLGEREEDEPGETLEELNRRIREKARALKLEVKIVQSNHEGALVDALHAERKWADGVLVGPGALAYSSYVLRDALVAVGKPALEIHLADLGRNESWRARSVLRDACVGQVIGKGFDSYLEGLERLVSREEEEEEEDEGGKRGRAEPKGKTLGRKGEERSPGAALTPAGKPSGSAPARGSERPAAGKTLGRPPTRGAERAPSEGPTKYLGRKSQESAVGVLTRALIRQKIADRLAGKLTAAGLATWARTQWLEVQRGAPSESGQREVLEDSLQALLAAALPGAVTDDQLIELMTQLEG